MAILLVGKDGTSNAKAGDIVVTGGGLFRKNEDGTSTKVGSLDTATGSSGNYSDVVSMFGKLVSGGASLVGGSVAPVDNIRETIQPGLNVKAVDANGIASVDVSGYDPRDYDYASTSGSSSAAVSRIAGYGILIIVGIAFLDRLMSKGGN